MRKFDKVNELVNTLKPDYPVYCIRPKSIKKSVEFSENSPYPEPEEAYNDIYVQKDYPFLKKLE